MSLAFDTPDELEAALELISGLLAQVEASPLIGPTVEGAGRPIWSHVQQARTGVARARARLDGLR